MTMNVAELQPRPTQRIQTRWRRIISPFPVPQSLPIIQRLRAVEPMAMSGMPPVLWHEAEGFLVRDPYGNQWIDVTSGIVLANGGHCHPKVVSAIRTATSDKLLATYAFPNEARCRLLEKLISLWPVPNSKAMLFSTGTEANECAIMLMRRYGQAISASKVGILSFATGFHGRTLGASLAGGSAHPSDWIDRQHVHHYQIPYPFCPQCPWGRQQYDECGEQCFHKCLDHLDAGGVRAEQIAGMIVEPIVGWATWPMPRDFVRAMFAWARRHDILITFDEIQAGCGRSGSFFAFEHVGETPDLITLGKGLSSSLPVSAVIGPQGLMDGPEPGEMSSTHSGNPVCAVAALANLEVIEDENLVEVGAQTGAAALEELQKLNQEFPQRIRSIHGPGLFLSVHLKRPDDGEPDIELADAVAHEAVRRGVLMFVTGRGFLKFTPPLCIEREAAVEAASVIKEAVIACVG